MTRVREEAGRLGHGPAVRAGLAATGGVITSAGLVLAATFAALLLAPLVAFVEIGVTVAVGVLIDTLLVRSTVVPALALDVGRAFWWPSGTGRTGPADRRNAPTPPGVSGETGTTGGNHADQRTVPSTMD